MKFDFLPWACSAGATPMSSGKYYWTMLLAVSCLAMQPIPAATIGLAQAREFNDPVRTINAPSGRRILAQFYWDINQDCSVPRGFNIAVERTPENGAVQLQKSDRVVSLGMAQSRERRGTDERRHWATNCLGRPITVISLYYTSRPGFRGTDRFHVVSTWPAWNRVRRQDFRIVVY